MNSTGRDAFERAHEAWASGDFGRFMSYLHEDILYLVNVDGMQVPYAMSALGKADAEQRLALLVRVFVVERFSVEKMVHEADDSWSRVHGVYRHRKTGEILDTRLRFQASYKNGLIAKLEETLDAHYVEAFERFVFYLQQHLDGEG